MPSLTIVTGENAGKQFVLAKRPLSIGRDPARDIQVIDPKVSRKHAIVRPEGDGHALASAKALNGVIINGNEIDAERVLADGDRIQLGDTELVYASSDEPDRTNALHQRKQADRKLRENNTLM
jgi:two-component system cell cycle response regulator